MDFFPDCCPLFCTESPVGPPADSRDFPCSQFHTVFSEGSRRVAAGPATASGDDGSSDSGSCMTGLTVTTPPNDQARTGTEPAADGATARVLAERLDAAPDIGPATAQIILAEIRTDMRLPHPRTPRLVGEAVSQNHPVRNEERRGPGRAGQPRAQGSARGGCQRRRPHQHLPRRPLPAHRQAPRSRQSPRRRHRSILVIAWHLINDPGTSYQELGADWHQRHLNPARTTRDLVHQLQALGHQVTLEPVTTRPAPPRHPVRKRPECCRLPSRRSIFRSASAHSRSARTPPGECNRKVGAPWKRDRKHGSHEAPTASWRQRS